MMPASFSAADALAGLKNFQQKTVEYVFKRFYLDDDWTSRFLVADEAGLGKTLVARGIIAKTLERLRKKHPQKRIDVLYICSNAAIAKQNLDRLNVRGLNSETFSTRLTCLPRDLNALRENKVNFISLTPATAFDLDRHRGGRVDERVIIYKLLSPLRWANNERRQNIRHGLSKMLQATVIRENWVKETRKIRYRDLDSSLAERFREEIRNDEQLNAALRDCCERFSTYRGTIPKRDSNLRYDLVKQLRGKLADVGLRELRPALIILDEFQRFKDILDGDDEAARLAQALFSLRWGDLRPRVLLLSATPYKMFTLDQEQDEDDHYTDFIKTLDFLFNNDGGKVGHIQSLLSEHRQTLHAPGQASAQQKKAELEQALLNIMCRTERVSATLDHNSLLEDRLRTEPPTPADLRQAAEVDKAAVLLEAGEQIEYWKSMPYLFNFLKGYDLRKKLDRLLDRRFKANSDLQKIISAADKQQQLLTKNNFEACQALEPGNPRMRALFKDTINKGLWQLLWMPPSMPYIEPGGEYQDKNELTKALVFSSWNAVPDAIASICSHAAESKMIGGTRTSREPLLRFGMDSKNIRPTGMPVIAWLLPSPTLASKIDPLEIALRLGRGTLSAEDMKAEVKDVCLDLLKKLKIPPKAGEGKPDQRWYWAAPILLDARNENLLDWCRSEGEKGWRAATPDHEPGRGFIKHIESLVGLAENMAKGVNNLGPQPPDLPDVLGELALAGPGVCALRALLRIGDGLKADDSAPLSADDPALLSAAAQIASGFRTLFNMPAAIARLAKPRGSGQKPYWRSTLQYGLDGNLQAVLDEYVHVLREYLGLQAHSPEEQVKGVADCINSVLSLGPARIKIDGISEKPSGDGFAVEDFHARCRFALRFGGDMLDDNDEAVHAGLVRDAFNSPFYPFVLASTSKGQEGLDFHTWCHAVTHWNLPYNPVDLEQREGRVQRYKGHAVRKNIAAQYGLATLSGIFKGGDPWRALFDKANQDKPKGLSDLHPYWIFEGPAKVERRVPLLPCSKEIGKLERLKYQLLLYRLVLGQPRQEDLLRLLERHGAPEPENQAEYRKLLISLQPPD